MAFVSLACSLSCQPKQDRFQYTKWLIGLSSYRLSYLQFAANVLESKIKYCSQKRERNASNQVGRKAWFIAKTSSFKLLPAN